MTKARTVSAKRRIRRIPRKAILDCERQPNGQPARIRSAEREEAMRASTVARCKVLGILPRATADGPSYVPTADMVKRVGPPWMGCTAGRAIEAETDRAELWEAIKRVRQVYTTYWRTTGIPSPYAKIGALASIPDAFGSDGVEIGDRKVTDIRSIEDRVKSATAAMMRMETILGMAGYGVAHEVKRVVLSFREEEGVKDQSRYFLGLRAVVAG